MSIAYAEVGPTRTRSGTGAALYDPALLYADEFEADRRRTHIVSAVNDPVLQDVLENFQDALVHRLASMVRRVSRFPTPWQLTEPVLFGASIAQESQRLAQYWIPAGYAGTIEGVFGTPSASFASGGSVTVTSNSPQGILGVISGITGALQVVAAVAPRVSFFDETRSASSAGTSVHIYADTLREQVTARPSPPLAVNAVENISDWLGVPAADVFKATGIAKRTYQEWKRTGTRRPRSSSEGSLWELHQLAADLVETMGLSGVRAWFTQDPVRRTLLRSGAIDKLASHAYASLASTERRPSWVGAGSPEGHTAPRRDTTLGPMDQGDVAEPNS